jgi:hypothetical protein
LAEGAHEYTTPDDMKLATPEFLERTGFRTPLDAVQSAAPSLEDWCDLVSNHRMRTSTPENRCDLAQRLAQGVNA